MTTVVNTPSVQNESNGVVGIIVGLIGLAIIIYLFFVFGIPIIQNMRIGAPQVNIPTQIVVPEDVNVNVNK